MPRAFSRFLLTASLLTVLLAACVPALTPVPSPTGRGESALTPTATLTLTPTTTPTVTPTPTPTPLPHPAAFDDAFARGLIRYDAATGQWLVSVVQTADGEQQTADFLLLPDTFNTHDDLRARNPLAPLTVRARPLSPTPLPLGQGQGVREHTLLYHPDTAEFRVAYTFPTLFEGVGTENPRLIEENLDAIPFIPIEDIQSGLAAQSVLLAMQEDGYQPFDENTPLDEKRLRFELRKNGLRTAELLSLSNLDRNLNVNHHPIKVTPFLFKTRLPNGKEVIATSIAIFNPANRENWSPEEFIITFGVAQPVIALEDYVNFFRQRSGFFLINSLYLYATNPNLDPKDPNTILIPNPSNPDNPTLLDARDPFQSLLARLLGIEGNDARNLVSSDPDALYFPSAMTYLEDLGKTELGYGNTIEMPFPSGVRIPFEIQTMGPFLFEVGVAQ